MNIQQLEYIEAVKDLQSFEKAADRCFVTQSTLSTMVSRLEKELGIILFDRKTKPITVTREGEEVIRQAQTILREIGNLRQLVGSLKGDIEGEIRISAIPTVASFLLPLFLKDFISQHPRVQFTINEAITERIISDLTRRAVDIGILSTPIDHPELQEISLYREPFLLLDGENVNVHQEAVDIDTLDASRLWLLEEGHCLRSQVKKLCALREEQSFSLNMEYRAGNIDTLKRFVKLNGGITLIPHLATLDFTEREKAHLWTFREPVPVREISLVVHQHFIKKGILEQLKQAILTTVAPLISHVRQERVLTP